MTHLYWFRATGGYICGCGRPSNLVFQWIEYNPISILYKFQIDISSNSREIKYQNIGRTHRHTHRHTHRQTDRVKTIPRNPLRGRGNNDKINAFYISIFSIGGEILFHESIQFEPILWQDKLMKGMPIWQVHNIIDCCLVQKWNDGVLGLFCAHCLG